MASCKVNQIFVGEVASVQNYGAFVRIPGCSQQGLVHRSQVSSAHVDDVGDVLQRGDKIWCKVISTDNGKVALSMKLVNQGNGKDLDPNGVQLQLDQQKKKQYDPKPQKKIIVLDAVYKTVCTQCKTPGHLAKDCFSTPGGKKYELIPEIEDEKPVAKPPTEEKVQEQQKKSKKLKKRKRSKSSRQEDSDEDESDSSNEKNKKKRKKSKEQKRKKKKKRKDSSSDSDSSDSSHKTYENRKHSKKCKHSRAKHSD